MVYDEEWRGQAGTQAPDDVNGIAQRPKGTKECKHEDGIL